MRNQRVFQRRTIFTWRNCVIVILLVAFLFVVFLYFATNRRMKDTKNDLVFQRVERDDFLKTLNRWKTKYKVLERENIEIRTQLEAAIKKIEEYEKPAPKNVDVLEAPDPTQNDFIHIANDYTTNDLSANQSPAVHSFSLGGLSEHKNLLRLLDVDIPLTSEEKTSYAKFKFHQQEQYLLSGKCHENIMRNQNFEPTDRLDIYYELFVETISCDSMHRFGSIGDPGYWVCNPHRYLEMTDYGDGCTAYSIGLHTVGRTDDVAFESVFSETTGCEVHIFDYFPEVREHLWDQYGLESDFSKEIVFHELHQDEEEEGISSLQEIANLYGHQTIELLKIDLKFMISRDETRTNCTLARFLKHGEISNLKVQQIIFQYRPTLFQDGNLCEKRSEELYPLVRLLRDHGFYLFKMKSVMLEPSVIQYHFVHEGFV